MSRDLPTLLLFSSYSLQTTLSGPYFIPRFKYVNMSLKSCKCTQYYLFRGSWVNEGISFWRGRGTACDIVYTKSGCTVTCQWPGIKFTAVPDPLKEPNPAQNRKYSCPTFLGFLGGYHFSFVFNFILKLTLNSFQQSVTFKWSVISISWHF